MREEGRRAGLLLVALPLFFLGIALRVVHWDSWPPGPWIDEAYAIRSARIVLSEPGHPLFGSSPLTPPDAGFVNSYSSNLYLYASGLIDRLAGGGLFSFRVLSIGPSILLLAVALLLAGELLGASLWAFGFAASLLATSSWLLTTARWGWNAVSTSWLIVMAVWLLVRALKREARSFPPGAAHAADGSNPGAPLRRIEPVPPSRGGIARLPALEPALAGLFLGLAQYGYVAAWLVFPLPFLAGASFWVRGQKRTARILFTAAAVSSFVAAPYALHLLVSPGRATARTGELLIFRQPLASTPRLLLENVSSYGRLFVSGGDPNERHGDPAAPVLPPLVTLFALAGAWASARRPGEALLLLLSAGLLISGGLLSYQGGEANSYRISLSAPFLLVLSGYGALVLLERTPRRFQGPGRATLVLAGILAASSGVFVFIGWADSDRLKGAFGGPERALAGAISAVRKPDAAPVLLDPAAVRNHHVVDALLRNPESPSPAVRLIDVSAPDPVGRTSAGRTSARQVLLVLSAEESRAPLAHRLGARAIAQGGALPGFPGWIVYSVDPEPSRP